ncbi:hypothetical protein HJC23_013868 [Cyclotella cryptica]|uniref:Fluoride ion transporter CrcB n=1 Tax=Cyclotella cryptica TaxID=29204 RepID=A0ABD3QG38_9STRA|eukprot:CCRYP_005449-RA/>CCRYP_005449-RA protein AED:0.00 eAED:0.00 QI:219/-1/1/1/-1/1/1/101/406
MANDDNEDEAYQNPESSSDPTETGHCGSSTNNPNKDLIDAPASGDDSSSNKIPIHHIHKWNWLHIFYLSTFSIFGITIRAFMGRFFGGDCDADATVPINDWLTPISRHVCVTTSGRTDQYGGALFIDLPANMFGSLIMGFVTGHSTDWPVLAVLKHDHPLQNEDGLHLGLKTALCGTITTFSSWNAQMVLMMDGTGTVLGSQVIAALFGYVLGLQVSISCFRAGRTLAAWFHLKNNPHIFDSVRFIAEDHTSVRMAETTQLKGTHLWNARILPSILASALFILFVLGDFYWGIEYYRQLWISCLFGPFGAIIRWKLSTFNGKMNQWIPIGTFISNFVASAISAFISAIVISSTLNTSFWTLHSLKAISLGFAGCLSTVSSMVKEVVEITDKNPHFDKRHLCIHMGQ